MSWIIKNKEYAREGGPTACSYFATNPESIWVWESRREAYEFYDREEAIEFRDLIRSYFERNGDDPNDVVVVKVAD